METEERTGISERKGKIWFHLLSGGLELGCYSENMDSAANAFIMHWVQSSKEDVQLGIIIKILIGGKVANRGSAKSEMIHYTSTIGVLERMGIEKNE